MHLQRLHRQAAATALAVFYTSTTIQSAWATQTPHAGPNIVDRLADSGLDDGHAGTRGGLQYEPHFEAFDADVLGRRAERDLVSLVSNVPFPSNLGGGETQTFVFPSTQFMRRDKEAVLELRDIQQEDGTSNVAGRAGPGSPDIRQGGRLVYISANTCLQPHANSSSTGDTPQLNLYVSNSTKNTTPGPFGDATTQVVLPFNEGAVMYNFTTANDIYISVGASNLTAAFSTDADNVYNFQLAVSTDGWYHSYDESNDADLIWVDSDASSVLLMTHNLTTSTDETVIQSILATQPYIMFAQSNDDVSINGLRLSYCGLNLNAQIAAVRNGQDTSQVLTSMTRRGAGNLPKQQFFFSGLNASTSYRGILASNANASTNVNVVGGGGHVFKDTSFETKPPGANCAVIYNLTFCDQVAWAVPSNKNRFPNPDNIDLANFYDTYAQAVYANFTKNLQQVACDAPAEQAYSLARNCTDCQTTYKNWLCSVTMPRCEDFSSTDAWLQPRAITQAFQNGTSLPDDVLVDERNQLAYTTSRNPLIDSEVQPGPYKEVLPCDDMCYDVVRSCPASLQFSCPRPGSLGFNTSYWDGSSQGSNGTITCNYPGSAHYISGGSRSARGVRWYVVGMVFGLGLLMNWS